MKVLFILFSGLLLFSCDMNKLSETPISQFVGTWRLDGRGMYQDMEVKISMNDKNEFSGTVIKLNQNKYVQLFVSEQDVFVTEIKRTSNFQFILKEKKIASELFSSYGNATTQEYQVEFKDKNTILLGKNGSSGTYIRVSK